MSAITGMRCPCLTILKSSRKFSPHRRGPQAAFAIAAASVASGRLMRLSYTGGKTGNRYTFAVGYFPWDGECSRVEFGQLAEDSWKCPRCAPAGQRPAVHSQVDGDQGRRAEGGYPRRVVRRNGAQAAKGLMLGLSGAPPAGSATLFAAGAKTTFACFAPNPRLRRRSHHRPTVNSATRARSEAGLFRAVCAFGRSSVLSSDLPTTRRDGCRVPDHAAPAKKTS